LLRDNLNSVNNLEIDGEIWSISIIFDDTNVWQQDGSWVFFPAVSASGSVSGGHTVSVNTPTPAISTNPITGQTIMSEGEMALRTPVSLIIDGNMPLTSGAVVLTNPAPSLGENLSTNHLPTDTRMFENISDFMLQDFYSLTNKSITISTIPIPASIWLFGSGLLGLIGIARRKAWSSSYVSSG
jgi:hypothetical protein